MLNNIYKIFKNDFKQRLKVTLIWTVLIIILMAMYMLLYPIVDEIMANELEKMPDELLKIIGVSNTINISNYCTYFAMIYQVILIAFCGYGVFNGSNIINEEERNKTIDFIYSLNVSRTEIFIAKLFVVLVNCLIIISAAFITTIFSGLIVAKDTFQFKPILVVYAITAIAIYFFVALGILLSVLAKRSLKPYSIGLGLMFGTYIIGYLGEIVHNKLSFLEYISPIHIVSANNIMESNIGIGEKEYILLPVIILGMLQFILYYVACQIYKKKDF